VKLRIALGATLLTLLLSGCVAYEGLSLRLDLDSGDVEFIYHDIRSEKGKKESDYSIEQDWHDVKGAAREGFREQYDNQVVKSLTGELFEENGTLSGRFRYRVVCPECHESAAAVLDLLFDNTWRIESTEEHVYLYLSDDQEAVSCNGKISEGQGYKTLVWPAGQKMFEFTLKRKKSGGESLLPFFLKEHPPEEAQVQLESAVTK